MPVVINPSDAIGTSRAGSTTSPTGALTGFNSATATRPSPKTTSGHTSTACSTRPAGATNTPANSAKTYLASPSQPTSGHSEKAGQQLIDLHLGYETCQPWPLQVVTTGDPDDPDLYRIDRTIRWGRGTQHRRQTATGQDRPSHKTAAAALRAYPTRRTNTKSTAEHPSTGP